MVDNEIYPHIRGELILNLKFRQIKCLAMHRRRKKSTWFVLNRQVPLSISNKTINEAIDFVQSKFRILRMYQTASEWFNPTTLVDRKMIAKISIHCYHHG